ncbi:MAG: hypothetical protein A2X86_03030 [Bdellovibrionales bacterium GWA2_49_15]|nr:MAG: hypothetical protein A2X86_03030 [Bdellovibrionales bacterium GWA2_49_15]
MAYQQIKSKGFVGWGNAKTIEELGDIEMHEFLKSSTKRWIQNPEGKMALDLGCGSGTTAFTLAKLGFSVRGIDISETAIAMATDLAKKQNLKIRFEVGDILQLDKLNEQFDLIYDSHCLHCIVFDEDRRLVLEGIRNALTDSGIFLLDTMIAMDKVNPADGLEMLRFDTDYILWHKTSTSSDRGVIEIDGQYWCAQRRIYPEAKVLDEISEAGFKVMMKSLDSQGENHPRLLRLVLKR